MTIASAVVAAGSLVGVGLASAPAGAAPAACLDTLYTADNASGDVRAFDPDTGTVGDTLYRGRPGTGSSQINQLGIGRGGQLAVSTVGAANPAGSTLADRIVRWRDSAPTNVAKPTDPAPGTVAGAIDPASGLHYYGGYSGNSLTLFAYDPTGAGTSIGRVATVTVPEAPGTNGDIAFSSNGSLYFVAASPSVTALYRLNVKLPTTSGNPTLSDVTELSRTKDLPGASNGIAFASDGRLYLGRSKEFTRVNPITGASEEDAVPFTGDVASTDLGSCAGPNTVTIEVRAPDGEQNPGDQFTGTLDGGSYDSPGAAAPPTSSFPAGPGGAVSEPAVVLPGETYTVGVTPGAGNGPKPYAGNYTCTDVVTREIVAFGSGSSTDLSLPEGAGATVNCVFDMEEPKPGIDLVKTVSPQTFDSVDDGPLRYTFAVTNAGNTPLSDLRLTDELAGLGPITCEPVAQGGALPSRERVPGSTSRLRPARSTCSAQRPLTDDDVKSGQAIVNSADVSAAPPRELGSARTVSRDQVTADNVVEGPSATDDSVGAQLDQTVRLPAATDDDAGSAAIDLAATRLIDPDGAPVTELEVAGVGTFTVVTRGDGAGTVTFTPAAGYVGRATAPYRIVDANGFTADGSLTVTVRPGPSAVVDDAGTTDQNVDVVVPVLDNDRPGQRPDGTDGAFDTDTLRLVLTDDLPAGSTLSDDRSTLTVPGEGTWTAIRRGDDAGSVRFDPETGFTGIATPVTYRVEDQAGNPVSSTISAQVDAVTPVAVDDTVKTAAGTAVRFDPLANDLPGAATAALQPSSVVLTSPDASDGGKRLVVAGEGTWVVGGDGFVRFTPVPGHDGRTTPVGYRVADANGTTTAAEMVVVVGRAPVADNDSASTPQATAVVVDVLDGDTPGDQGAPCTAPGEPAGCNTGTFDAGSVAFPADGQPDGAVVSTDGRTLDVPGQGTWTVDPAGTVTFTPEPGFSGPADEVTYEVTDSYDNTTTGTIVVVVRSITPSAAADTAATPHATAVKVRVLDNDTPGADGDVTPPLRPASTVFSDRDLPAGAELSGDAKTLTVPREGVYVIGPDGVVEFTPAGDFSGTASPVRYQVGDANGSTDSATLTITVAAGPTARSDSASTSQATPVTLRPLRNDTAGVDPGTGASGRWDLATVAFPTADQPVGAVVSDDRRRLTVRGEGVYAIADDGAVTFTPAAGFRGAASPVTYTVRDEFNNPVTSTIEVTVRGIDPVATDDRRATAFNTAVTVDLLANDRAGVDGDVSPQLRPALTEFTTGGQPVGAVLSADRTTLTLPGQGEYVLRPDGSAVFTPVGGFSGALPAVTYQITDANGATDTAELTVVVAAGPRAVDDRDTTAQNRPVTLDPLGNDTPSIDPATGEPSAWDRGSVSFTRAGQPAGSTLSDDQRSLTVPGQGVHRIDPATGRITFTPEARFRGETTPVRYRVADELGNATQADVTIEVGATVPTAADDRARTPHRTPVTLDVLGNDAPGSSDVPIVGSSLRLVDPATGDRVGELVVRGEGTWTVTVDGRLRFAPEDGFSGRTTPVTYTVLDSNGSQATARATVLVDGPGEAQPSAVATSPGTPVTVDVLDHVTPAPGQELVPGTVCVLPSTITVDGKSVGAGNPERCVDRFTQPAVGTWVVDPDGTVTFTPVPGFTGKVAIDFQVTDTGGDVYTTTLTVTVAGGDTSPVATSPGAADVDDDGGLLPNAGGPALWALLAGLGLLVGGGLVVRRSRRAPGAGAHSARR